jgi:hypothetical protein
MFKCTVDKKGKYGRVAFLLFFWGGGGFVGQKNVWIPTEGKIHKKTHAESDFTMENTA